MVRLFRALLSAVLLYGTQSSRIHVESEELQPVWDFNGLAINPDNRGPLLPGLVPPPGTTFEVINREMELGVGSVANNYRWAFMTINQGGQAIPVNQWFAEISGEGFFGVWSGTRRTVARNNLGQDLFVIEAARRSTSTSWRIRHPMTNQILFTINKDFWGAGFLAMRDEWRIYRGRERDGDQIYYIVSDYSSHNHQFFHNEDEYQNSQPAAATSRNYSPGGTYTQGFISDSIGVSVGPGEDTALIMSTTIVIDMLNEVRAANRRAQEARQREERVTGHRRRRRSGATVEISDDRRRRVPDSNSRNERREVRRANRRANRAERRANRAERRASRAERRAERRRDD